MTYLSKRIIQWCQDARGRELEPCHDRRNGKVAFQMDVHMVIRGIIVCVCVVDFFRGEGREEENLPQGEKIIHLKVEFRPKQRKLDLENLVVSHSMKLTNKLKHLRKGCNSSHRDDTHIFAIPRGLLLPQHRCLCLLWSNKKFYIKISFHNLWLINTSSVMLFNSKSFM